MQLVYRLLVVLIFLLFASASYGSRSNQQPPAIGNFALSTSQQPGPLVGFGENIINKNQIQLFLAADDFGGVNKHFVDVIPSILYGITDALSIFINAPIAASYVQNANHSSGFEDAFIQLEDAFYTRKTQFFIDQATIVGNITFPTGSATKQPPTGAGSPSFFLGTTFNRMYTDWFVFISPGAMLTTTNDNTKLGDEFLYQFGFGRNIKVINGWLFAWMLEVDGQYTQRNKINGTTDLNSGGNVIYATPSLWISSKKLILQLGAGVPIEQSLYGNQTRNSYLLIANLGWTFN
jgi:hypothetical protein